MPNEATESEGAVQWDQFAAFHTGAAKEEPETTEPDNSAAPETDGSPELVEVSIRGRKVKMAREDADAYQTFIRDVRERDGRLGGELQQLRERLAKTEGSLEAVAKLKAAETEIQPPDVKLAEEDFAEYHRQMLKYQDARLSRARAELLDQQEQTERTRREQASRGDAESRWVDGFYKRFDHLNGDIERSIVGTTYKKHEAELEALRRVDPQGAQEALAELADAALVTLRAKAKNNSSRRPPALESPGVPAARTPAEKPAAPMSAASWSQKHRAKLRGATK